VLEHFFRSRTRMRQLRRGPLEEHIDAMAADLQNLGYAKQTGLRVLSFAGQFSRFARSQGVVDARQMDENLAKRFVEECVDDGVYEDVATIGVRHVLRHLRSRGLISPKAVLFPDVMGSKLLGVNTLSPGVALVGDDPLSGLLGRYDIFLRDVKALVPLSRELRVRHARIFLEHHVARHGRIACGDIDTREVMDFVKANSNRNPGRGWIQQLCSNTRGILRFLSWEELASEGLDRAVPKIPRWRAATLPRHLPWQKVRALIDSVDTAPACGKRDKAMLLLFAMLGLRNHDVRTLRLEHIAWREAEIRLPRTKNRRARSLPLPQEVGEAIAHYILHGRPASAQPFVFLRHMAPHTLFHTSSGVAGIILRHLRRARIKAPRRGAHLLRHSLAARMVNVGVPIKEIADMLGHASLESSSTYAKVDLASLGIVPLAFPGSPS